MVNLPNTIVDLPNTMVDLPNTMLDLPNTMVFAQTDGIVSVLLDHTRTRGPSVTRMRDFFCLDAKTTVQYVAHICW